MFSNSPFLTRILLHQAARRSNLTAEQHAQLNQILSSRSNLSTAGQVLDDMSAPDGAPLTAKLGDGTLLKLLIDNLPAIIAAIMEIIKAIPVAGAETVSTQARSVADVRSEFDRNCGSAMPTEFALPPAVATLAAELGKQLLAAVVPVIESELKKLIANYATD